MRKEIKIDKKLVIAGGSSHSQAYFNQIKEMTKDDDTIIMTDFVSGQTLHELFSNSLLYILPSDIEGMPMSLLEAMSYGNCCLVSNIPENLEIINDACYSFEKGNVEDLKEKLKYIINSNICLHKEAVVNYTWESVVDECLEVYK